MAEEKDAKKWIKDLYNTKQITSAELSAIYEEFKYQGFNREQVLQDLSALVPDTKLMCKIIIVCALRGPVRAAQTEILPGRTISSMGIPSSRGKAGKGLSCGRVLSATADLAAHFLKALDVPKRIPGHPCPAWLQFPSAGSIDLPSDLREVHKDFSVKFSHLIKKKDTPADQVFNEQIYEAMVANRYYDRRLRLFGE